MRAKAVTDPALQGIFDSAFSLFLSEERANILSGVSERNLCARLMLYMELVKANFGLETYYADTEYNRKQHGQVKTIIDESMEIISVTCDLIFHSRGESLVRDNLIALEMKKTGRPESEAEKDRKRLRALTKYNDVWSFDGTVHPEHVCGYELGLFVTIDRSRCIYTVERYVLGEYVNENGGAF